MPISKGTKKAREVERGNQRDPRQNAQREAHAGIAPPISERGGVRGHDLRFRCGYHARIDGRRIHQFTPAMMVTGSPCLHVAGLASVITRFDPSCMRMVIA